MVDKVSMSVVRSELTVILPGAPILLSRFLLFLPIVLVDIKLPAIALNSANLSLISGFLLVFATVSFFIGTCFFGYNLANIC